MNTDQHSFSRRKTPLRLLTLFQALFCAALLDEVQADGERYNSLTSRASIRSEILPSIPPFPIPVTRHTPKIVVCSSSSDTNLSQYNASDQLPWIKRRVATVVQYNRRKRSCCNLEVSYRALLACINGHRRDVLNNFCTAELADDVEVSRAHPCCFALSSQRYTCFERYDSDVIKPQASIDSSRQPMTKRVSIVQVHEAKIEIPQEAGACTLTQVAVDEMCYQASDLSRDDMSELKDRQAGRRRCRKLLAISREMWLRFELKARSVCCVLPGRQRLECFEAKQREQQDILCNQQNHICCNVTGQDRYDCFESAARTNRKSVGTRVTPKPSGSAPRVNGHVMQLPDDHSSSSATVGASFPANAASNATDSIPTSSPHGFEDETTSATFTTLRHVTTDDEQRLQNATVSTEVAMTTAKTTQSRKKQWKSTIKKKKTKRVGPCCKVGTIVRKKHNKNYCYKGIRALSWYLRNIKLIKSKACRYQFLKCCRT